MQKRTKEILRYVNMALIAGLLIILFLYINFVLRDDITKKFFTGKPVSFAVLLYGTEKVLPESLDVFLVRYERETKILKVLSVNPDTVVFRKKARARSFGYSFFETARTDVNLAVTNFYTDLFEMLDNSFTPDFNITMSYESLLEAAGKNDKLRELILKDDFPDRDSKCLKNLETAETFLEILKNRFIYSVYKINKHYNIINTPLKKFTLFNIAFHFRITDAKIVLCELPVRYTQTRVEPDRANIVDFLYTIYYPDTRLGRSGLGGLIEVKNASGKPRMAEKAAWKLRENKFDVLDWSNSPVNYETTLIKDYKGNFGEALEIAKILGCGKPIISYNNRSYYGTGVFVGKDCEIYDKLDKINDKEGINGKN